MHTKFVEICEALDSLAQTIVEAWPDDQRLSEHLGWMGAPLNRHELAFLPQDLAERLRKVSPESISAELLEYVDGLTSAIRAVPVAQIFVQASTSAALSVFNATIAWVTAELSPYLEWTRVEDPQAMPVALARRVRAFQARLTSISPDIDALAARMKDIEQAHDAAIALPTDMTALEAARKDIEAKYKEVLKNSAVVSSSQQASSDALISIQESLEEARKIVEQCGEAYRVTTSVGLAAAFDERATRLANSMWVWVGGLIVALIVGAAIGSHRVLVLSSALQSANRDWGTVFTEAVLSILSVSAPLWLAWLSTKQIGQRFRLSEDYAFKSSVAKAYEGYRREASRIDEAFEARLFSSALTRLEEPPLRLVEPTAHGSPWQDLITSEAFRRAMDTVPELKDQFVEIAKQGVSRLKPKQGEEATPVTPPTPKES